MLRRLGQVAIDLLGASGKRSLHATRPVVRLGGQQRPGPLSHELGQRVLQHRERSGLVDHVADDPGHQAGLEFEPCGCRRPGDRLCQLVTRRHRHRDERSTQHRPEVRLGQRTVEEVRAHRDHHSHPPPSVTDRGGETVEEAAPGRLVGRQREQFFELIDDQQQFAVVVRQDLLTGPEESPVVGEEVGQERSVALHGHTQQRSLQLLEGERPGEHVGDQHLTAGAEHPAPDGGEQPGPNQTRLAAAGRADHGGEPVIRDVCDQRIGERLPTEEVVGVGLTEGPESLVRVPDVDRHVRFAGC